MSTGHKPTCLTVRADDDDWNGATAAAYRRQFGAEPPCTCEEPTTDLCEECFGGGCDACKHTGLVDR